MALNSNTLSSEIQAALDQLVYDNGKFVADGVQVTSTEHLANVIAEKVIEHFENNAEITIQNVQAGSDNANGTIS